MATALILEDDTLSAMAMSLLLEDKGYTTHVAHNIESALELAHQISPSLLVADWSLNGKGSSLYVAEAVRRNNPRARVVFVSGYPEEEVRAAASTAAPCSVFQKPLNFEAFCAELPDESAQAVSVREAPERAAS